MARETAGLSQVAYVVEVTENTTPATPAFQKIRATGESLDVQRKINVSNELNGKRGARNYTVATAYGEGTIPFKWTDGSLEDLLESLMRAAWSADQLDHGNTPKFLTFEAKAETGGTDIYKRFAGSQVASMSLNLRAGEDVEGSFNIMARTADFYNAAVAGATYTEGNTEVVNTGAHVGSIAMAGLTLDCLAAITCNIDNSLMTKYCLGTLAPHSLDPGDLKVSGTLAAYMDSARYDMLRAYADGTATGIDFRIGSTAGKITRFQCPTVVLSDLKKSAESADGDTVMISANWTALQSSTLSGGLIRINRNV